MGLVSRKICGFLFRFSTAFTSFSVLLLFPVSITFFVFKPGFDAISSNIDEVLSINPSANLFVSGDFHVQHNDWLISSGGTGRPGELCYNFTFQTMLLRWLTFLLGSLTVTLTILRFWIYFFLLTVVFVLQWLSLHW